MNNVTERKRIFEYVRDIPYRIRLNYSEPNYICDGKYKMFVGLAKKYGIKTRPVVCDTAWGLLELPEEIRNIPHDDNDIAHIYPKVYIPEKEIWVPVVDSTWDIRLKGKHTAIHVNEWDGYSTTIPGFPSVKTYNLKDSTRFAKEELTEEEFEEDMKENGRFYEAFNNWLELLRQLKV